MNCPRCFKNYDLKNNIPKILNKCGHSICSKCLETIFINKAVRCPKCIIITIGNNIGMFQNNYEIIKDLNKQNLNENLNIGIKKNINKIHNCEFHSKKYDAFCQTCKKLICINCIISYDQDNIYHKEHEILTIENSYNNEKEIYMNNYNLLFNKKKKYESFLENLEFEFIDIEKLKETNLKKINIIYKELKKQLRFYIKNLSMETESIYNKSLERLNKGKNWLNEKIVSINELYTIIDSINSQSQHEFLKQSQFRNALITRVNDPNDNEINKLKNLNKKEINTHYEKYMILKKILETYDTKSIKNVKWDKNDCKFNSINNIKNKQKINKTKTQNDIKKVNNNNKRLKKSILIRS